MKTVQRIIDAHGGLAALNALKIESPGFMDLHIERIGIGPRGLPLVSVAHYYTQNGDAMRDPDMTFEVDALQRWYPITYRQDGLGVYQEAVSGDDNGQLCVRLEILRDLERFARMWDRNLREQGFEGAEPEQREQVAP